MSKAAARLRRSGGGCLGVAAALHPSGEWRVALHVPVRVLVIVGVGSRACASVLPKDVSIKYIYAILMSL
jgi:hypothetical protein